jgi:hypothetical protein
MDFIYYTAIQATEKRIVSKLVPDNQPMSSAFEELRDPEKSHLKADNFFAESKKGIVRVRYRRNMTSDEIEAYSPDGSGWVYDWEDTSEGTEKQVKDRLTERFQSDADFKFVELETLGS